MEEEQPCSNSLVFMKNKFCKIPAAGVCVTDIVINSIIRRVTSSLSLLYAINSKVDALIMALM